MKFIAVAIEMQPQCQLDIIVLLLVSGSVLQLYYTVGLFSDYYYCNYYYYYVHKKIMSNAVEYKNENKTNMKMKKIQIATLLLCVKMSYCSLHKWYSVY